MNTDIALLQFANLLGVAEISSAGGKSYERQEELIKLCREKNMAFVAIMPLRNRFRCAECGVEQGESIYHFENPKIETDQDTSKNMWGPTKGLFAQLNTEELHYALAHGKEMPASLLQVLSSVRC